MELEELRRQVESSGADWTPGETVFSQYEVDDSMEMLGYVPGPDEPPLEAQEESAKSALESFAAPEERLYPESHDWRDVAGQDYIRAIKDQSACGSCVAFGSCATVEGTLRVQEGAPDLDVDLSEAQLFYCIARGQGRRCSGQVGGWWPAAALDAFRDEGVADEECYGYTAGDQDCDGLCANWQSRLTTITGWREINAAEDMKLTLSEHGPLVGTMVVYEDFVRLYRGGVYRHVAGARAGGHCISIVGYDDNQECWIGKNSWGTRWGEDGFFRIAYGDSAIDSSMWAVERVTPPTKTGV